MTKKDDFIAMTIGRDILENTKKVSVPGLDGNDVEWEIRSPTVAIRRKIYKSAKKTDGTVDPHELAIWSMIHLACMRNDDGIVEQVFSPDHYNSFLERDETEEWFRILTREAFNVLNPDKEEFDEKKSDLKKEERNT